MKNKNISIVQIARNDRKFLSKYAALFLTILGFLAITTSFAVLGYKISNENRQNAELLNVVGLEKTLSQQISKDILIIQKEWKDSQKFNTQSFSSLSAAHNQFEQIHRALQSGGEVAIGAASYQIAPLPADYGSDMDKIQTAWSPLKLQIDMLGATYSDFAAKASKLTERDKVLNARKTFSTEINEANKDAAFADDFVNASKKFAPTSFAAGANDQLNAEVTKTSNTFNLYSNDLLSYVEKLNASINEQINQKAAANIRLQASMTALSLALFFILTFYFIRKNIVSDFIIFVEDKEKQAILDNINEGIFLMDTKWNIDSEGSQFLHKLFGRRIPVDSNFKQILADSVDADTLANAERFVNILITKNIKGSMIDSLNPLKLIALRAIDASGSSVEKYVSIHFGQIMDGNGKLKNILVGIQDSTEKQRLSSELREEVKKNKETFSMLARLGQSAHAAESVKLLGAIRALIESSNAKLKSGGHKEHQLMEYLQHLKNEVHGYKNESGLLGIDILQKLLHDFEDHLLRTEKTGNVTYENFLTIPYQFKNILEAVDLIELLLGGKPATTADATPAKLADELAMAVEQTAKKYGKQATFALDDSGFAKEAAYQRHAKTLRTCFLHLVKNSAVHGLEAPAARVAAGKEPTGSIEINGSPVGSHVLIRVADDGAGLDTARIRAKAAELGLGAKPLDELSDHEIHQFIFDHDFSTAGEVTLDAGRGVGLNFVKRSVEEWGGSVVAVSRAGLGAEFVISFPA